MKSSLFRPLAAGLALALASGVSTVAVSATADAPSAAQKAPDQAHKGDHRHVKGHRPDGLFIPGLGPLPKAELDALKLTAEQQKQVDALRTAQRDAHKGMRDEMRANRTALKQQLDAGKLDPRALAKQADAKREAHHKAAKATEDQALAIWDGLSDAQKTQVTAYVKARHEKMAQRRAAHEARHGGQPAASSTGS